MRVNDLYEVRELRRHPGLYLLMTYYIKKGEETFICTPTEARDEIGLSERTVIRYNKRLVEMGFISKEIVTGKGFSGKRNRFTVHLKIGREKEAVTNQSVESNPTETEVYQ